MTFVKYPSKYLMKISYFPFLKNEAYLSIYLYELSYLRLLLGLLDLDLFLKC